MADPPHPAARKCKKMKFVGEFDFLYAKAILKRQACTKSALNHDLAKSMNDASHAENSTESPRQKMSDNGLVLDGDPITQIENCGIAFCPIRQYFTASPDGAMRSGFNATVSAKRLHQQCIVSDGNEVSCATLTHRIHAGNNSRDALISDLHRFIRHVSVRMAFSDLSPAFMQGAAFLTFWATYVQEYMGYSGTNA